jgi:hypothetical protein
MVPPRTYSHIGAAVVVAGTLAADPVQRRMPSGARSPDDRTLAQACRATAAVSLGTSPHARAPTGRRSDGSRPASSFDVPSSELIYVEDLRQEEVPDDHEGDQTEGNDHTSESVAWPDHHPNDRRRAQADRKPERRILHVAEHEVTMATRVRGSSRTGSVGASSPRTAGSSRASRSSGVSQTS